MNTIGEKLAGRTVFLTGCTGFIGSLILEQLLRGTTRHAPTRIYVLVRGKRQRTAQERLAALLATPLFAAAHAAAAATSSCRRRVEDAVQLVEGDLHTLQLPKDVDVVIHAAADIRFNLHIHNALDTDCQAADHLAAAAAALPHLAGFVHVSTAYASSHLPHGTRVGESIHPLPRPSGAGDLSLAEARELVERLAGLPPRAAEAEASALRRHWGFPNNYCMAKSLAERMLAHRATCSGLPLTIVRPTIVTATSNQHPLPGYIGNASGCTAFVVSIAIGMVRCSGIHPDSILDLIPADFVSSAVLLAAAHAGQNISRGGAGSGGGSRVGDGGSSSGQDLPYRVIHVGSSGLHPATVGMLYRFGAEQTAAAWPLDFALYRSPPPLDMSAIYQPPGWRYQLRQQQTGARVAAAAAMLRLSCQAQPARRLQEGWKAFKQVNSHSADFNLVFDTRQLQALAAASADAADAADFPCVWNSSHEWQSYIQLYLQGVWKRYVSKLGGTLPQPVHSSTSCSNMSKMSSSSTITSPKKQ